MRLYDLEMFLYVFRYYSSQFKIDIYELNFIIAAFHVRMNYNRMKYALTWILKQLLN